MQRTLMIMKSAVLFFLILAFPKYAQTATYYVSTATFASNSNSGLSIAQAWANPSYAAQMSQAGDTRSSAKFPVKTF